MANMKKKELQQELERLGVAFKPADAKSVLEKKLKKAENAIPSSNPASDFGALPESASELVNEGAGAFPPVEVLEEVPAEPPVEEVVEVSPAEEPAKEKPVEESLGFLGGFKIKITALSRETINGREYNRVSLANGTTTLINDDDLEAQRKFV